MGKTIFSSHCTVYLLVPGPQVAPQVAPLLSQPVQQETRGSVPAALRLLPRVLRWAGV